MRQPRRKPIEAFLFGCAYTLPSGRCSSLLARLGGSAGDVLGAAAPPSLGVELCGPPITTGTRSWVPSANPLCAFRLGDFLSSFFVQYLSA